jgi:hypothetical protein
MDEEAGSLVLNNDVVNAKFLLIRSAGEEISGDLYRITGKGLKVYSKARLLALNYPKFKRELKEYYLMIEIEKVENKEFINSHWDFKKLKISPNPTIKFKYLLESRLTIYGHFN